MPCVRSDTLGFEMRDVHVLCQGSGWGHDRLCGVFCPLGLQNRTPRLSACTTHGVPRKQHPCPSTPWALVPSLSGHFLLLGRGGGGGELRLPHAPNRRVTAAPVRPPPSEPGPRGTGTGRLFPSHAPCPQARPARPGPVAGGRPRPAHGRRARRGRWRDGRPLLRVRHRGAAAAAAVRRCALPHCQSAPPPPPLCPRSCAHVRVLLLPAILRLSLHVLTACAPPSAAKQGQRPCHIARATVFELIVAHASLSDPPDFMFGMVLFQPWMIVLLLAQSRRGGLRAATSKNFPAISRNFPHFPAIAFCLSALHACWCPVCPLCRSVAP